MILMKTLRNANSGCKNLTSKLIIHLSGVPQQVLQRDYMIRHRKGVSAQTRQKIFLKMVWRIEM